MDCSPPGSSVHGILQARILEWLPFPSPGDLPNPGIKPRSPAWQADSSPIELQGKPRQRWGSDKRDRKVKMRRWDFQGDFQGVLDMKVSRREDFKGHRGINQGERPWHVA